MKIDFSFGKFLPFFYRNIFFPAKHTGKKKENVLLSGLMNNWKADMLTVTFGSSCRIVFCRYMRFYIPSPLAVFNPSFRYAPTSLIPCCSKSAGWVRGWSCLSCSLFYHSALTWVGCPCRVSISPFVEFPDPGTSDGIEFSRCLAFLDFPL